MEGQGKNMGNPLVIRKDVLSRPKTQENRRQACLYQQPPKESTSLCLLTSENFSRNTLFCGTELLGIVVFSFAVSFVQLSPGLFCRLNLDLLASEV